MLCHMRSLSCLRHDFIFILCLFSPRTRQTKFSLFSFLNLRRIFKNWQKFFSSKMLSKISRNTRSRKRCGSAEVSDGNCDKIQDLDHSAVAGKERNGNSNKFEMKGKPGKGKSPVRTSK